MPNRNRKHYGPPAKELRLVNGAATTSSEVRSSQANTIIMQVSSVRLEQTSNGFWEVRDEAGLKGGLFRDYRSAVRFVKDEFLMLQPSFVSLTGGKRKD